MAKRRCDHCHLEYDESVLIADESLGQRYYFCCKGCQGVFHLLHAEGLEHFYAKKGEVTLEPPRFNEEHLERFDVEGFLERYVSHKDGFSEIALIIEGIHCSACVWLNEKVLSRQEGIVEVSINYSNHKAKVVWDPSILKLSKIIETIRSIGYNAYPYDPKSGEERAVAQRREYYAKLLVGIFASMNVMWIAIAQYAGYFTGMQSNIKNILNFAEFILATPTLFYTGSVYFKGAYYSFKHRYVSMDTLVATGASITYLFSLYAMFTKSAEVYFDSVTMIVTFVFAGKYLEVLTKKKVVDTLDTFSATMPTEVMVVSEGEKCFVRVEDVCVGDVIELRAGDRVAVDGMVVSGEGYFDLSSLTGESLPVFKAKGEMLLSGSICVESVVCYEAKADFAHSTFSKIASLLEHAMDQKPRIEKLANQISGYFSLSILGLALLTFIGWYLASGSFEKALIVAISVVVIACPCALSLATPVATLVGLGVGAKRGIIFKEASFLESMAKCDTIVFDKTGTLTHAKPEVVQTLLFEGYNPHLLYTFVESSNHPISQGIKRFLEASGEPLHVAKVSALTSVLAKGMQGVYEGEKIYVGSVEWMRALGYRFDIPKAFEGLSHLCIADERGVQALFGLKDVLKHDAKEAVSQLKALGMRLLIISGDHEAVVRSIAEQVGIDEVVWGCLPEDKGKQIDQLVAQGRGVVMVGDGINDTLALSKAQIAIAMGSGADVALEVSDVVLTREGVMGVYEALMIAKGSLKSIRQNLGFSLGYNVLTIPLAMAGYVIPLVAALSMSLSSLIVVGNAMRIGRILKKER